MVVVVGRWLMAGDGWGWGGGEWWGGKGGWEEGWECKILTAWVRYALYQSRFPPAHNPN